MHIDRESASDSDVRIYRVGYCGRPPQRLCSMIGRSVHINDVCVTQPVDIYGVGLIYWTILRMQLNWRTRAPDADHQ